MGHFAFGMSISESKITDLLSWVERLKDSNLGSFVFGMSISKSKVFFLLSWDERLKDSRSWVKVFGDSDLDKSLWKVDLRIKSH